MKELWTEKYRPLSLDRVVGQPQIVGRLKAYATSKELPHLLFAGPAGTGKTTCGICLARAFFGDRWRENLQELNASVSKDTPILFRIDGKIKRGNFEELDKLYFDKDTNCKAVNNLEVLTIDERLKVKWGKVSKILRHWTPKILRIRLDGGGSIDLTGNHSIMNFNEEGLSIRKASEIKKNDYLISFVTNLKGKSDKIELTDYKPKAITSRVKVLDELPLNEKNAWIMGLYTAEGAVGFRGETSGQVIFTLGIEETDLTERVGEFARRLDLATYRNLTSSGFDRTNCGAKQLRILNTQLAKFIEENFYDRNGRRARNKRTPLFIYDAPLEERIAYMKGLADGDGSGKWNEVTRISSRSEGLLIDTAWLSRISGVESSIFDEEARLIWKGKMKWKKSDLLPTDLLLDFFKSVEIKGNWRYELRHYLYEGERASSKEILKKVLGMVEFEKMDEKKKEKFELLKRAVESDLHVLKVKKVEVIDYNDWVYDVSIPDNEMFFAGKIPVLLHNSDERGIDVVRGKIKDFARTSPLGEAAFKLIFLDEADALTSDAQAALRRTMERFPRCRFILSCNFSSKIIEPIQSRCAVFRFKPIDSEEIKRYIGYIAQKEGIQITPEGMEALVYLAEGDLRKAINLLQVGASKERRVTEETLYKISSYPDPKVIKGIIKESLEGNFIKARNLLDKLLIEYGLSGEDVLDQIHGAIFNLSLPDDAMVEALGQLGEVAFRIIEGSNPRIQLDALLAKFAQIGKKIKGENESMYRGDI